MTNFFFVTEFTIVELLLKILLKKHVCIVSVTPNLFFFENVFNRIVNWAVKKGYASWALDECSDLDHLKGYKITIHCYDVFGVTEYWQREYFNFAKADDLIPDYARSYKLEVTNVLVPQEEAVIILGSIKKKFKNPKIIGLPIHTRKMYEIYFQEKIEETSCNLAFLSTFINISLLALINIYGILTCLKAISFKKPEDQTFVLIDSNGDSREIPILNMLADGGRQVVVERFKGCISSELRKRIGAYDIVDSSAGYLSPKQAFSEMGRIFRDSCRIFAFAPSLSPRFFRGLIALTVKRTLIKALLNRFQPKYFWCRDLYNPEHILRTQEMHKIGGETHSALHGYGGLTFLYPMFRYATFTRFYVFGKIFGERLYGDTWPKEMLKIPAGSFAYGNDIVEKIRAAKGRKDIGILTAVLMATRDEKLKSFVRAIATEFPDRKIILQVKSYFTARPETKEFVEACAEGLPNIEYSTQTPDAIFLRSAFVFSDSSTAVMEGIAFNVPTFMLDFAAYHRNCVFREYQGICVTETDQAIKRIHSLIDGSWVYPREGCADLIDLSGIPFSERLREGMGLKTQAQEDKPQIS